MIHDERRLLAVKVVHTVAWAFFASCVVGIPFAAWSGKFGIAGILISLVALEGIVLLVNEWRCPLTGVAARYTDERQDNFDIFLPLWLARYNKQIFGSLYVAGSVLTAVLWLDTRM